MRIAIICALLCLALPVAAKDQDPAKPAKSEPRASGPKKLLYTTTFYTATEAVVHGYEEGTQARIISLAKGGTVWEGTVGAGECTLVSTGRGAFRFVSDKKAAILVGTPSSCTAVGYFVRDAEGSFRSDRFFTQLPSSKADDDSRMIVWALEDCTVTVTDLGQQKKVLHQGKLLKGQRWELAGEVLGAMGSHVLDVKADGPKIQLQVYYDEGFFVPGADGRAAGRELLTYVGKTTNGVNDLNLISHFASARVRVEDVEDQKVIWEGTVAAGTAHTLTLSQRYVKITSDVEISASVSPYVHYKGGYAEHHFAAGAEGTGIETDLILTTPGELWLFAYYDGTEVTVTNLDSGEQVWKGTLGNGNAHGVHPGHGLYRVRATRGISVMGGSSACGAEYSPAAGMFAVDEELFKVIEEVRAQRAAEAQARGETLSEDAYNAPLNQDELKKCRENIRQRTGRKEIGLAELEQRAADVQKR